jgi:signal transduction histidine kinase
VAEAASRAKDEFLAMLGHELRNPVTALQLMKLRGDSRSSKEQKVIFNNLLQSVAGSLGRICRKPADAGIEFGRCRRDSQGGKCARHRARRPNPRATDDPRSRSEQGQTKATAHGLMSARRSGLASEASLF